MHELISDLGSGTAECYSDVHFIAGCAEQQMAGYL